MKIKQIALIITALLVLFGFIAKFQRDTVAPSQQMKLQETVAVPEQKEVVLKKSEPLDISSLEATPLSSIAASTIPDEAIVATIAPQKKEEKKITLSPTIEDKTGVGNVRRTNIGAELDYKLTTIASVGIAASTEVEDQKDASAWGEKGETEDTAAVKVKIDF